MKRAARMYISADALRHNLKVVRALAPAQRVWAVIKAEAYGHGMAWAAETLNPEADGLAVSGIEEALVLREWGHDGPILVLQGAREAGHWGLAAEQGLQLVVQHASQLAGAECAQGLIPDVWIKIDTGMHRLGIFPEAASKVVNSLRAMLGSPLRVHWMTHLACADEPERPENAVQIGAFWATIGIEQGDVSLANSASILTGLHGHFPARVEWVRPGIMLYGANPLLGQEGLAAGLRPVMTVEAPIIALRPLAPGMSVGYGGAWTAKRETCVATVAMGYADGYPRHAPCGTPVWVNGVLCPLVGRVSMDMLAVEIPKDLDVNVGDWVRLWGDGLPVERVAASAGTISYELLTRVADRLSAILV